MIADSHFHPPGVPAQAVWASDAIFNARNAAVVEMLREVNPSLVIHLGDVPHPVPGLPEHAQALTEARAIYAALTAPLLVVPGNHDVGDKPHPWAPAPSVSAEKHAVFATTWGPPWWVHHQDGCRFVGIDTPVLNSGLPLEAAQWEWLEEALRPGPRTFIFVHYPPFLLTHDEPEHYDNLAEPARTRLFALFARGGVEAVFCGHVHHPFWNRHAGIDYYLLPSTAFVRPEYSELGRVGPADEFGRNDTDRLGFCLLWPGETRHRMAWVRTGGAVTPGPAISTRPPACPLGLTLRHAWDAVLDIPADGLEPFRRKQARNDLVLFATWELGVRLLRLPFDDLRRDSTRTRLTALAERGQRVVAWTAEPLTPDDIALVAAHRDILEAVELIVPRAWLDRPLPELAVPRWVAAFGRAPDEAGRYFSHFAPHGFRPGDPDVSRARGEGVVYRIDPERDPMDVAAIRAERGGARSVALILLPRAGESRAFTDDHAVAQRVERAFHAAVAHPEITFVLDTTADHDRGYFPRNGLVDRRGNPREAFRLLARLAVADPLAVP